MLYWMQHTQRAERNDAQEFAVQQANTNQVRLVVAFGRADVYPDANLRHYQFMLEGLQEVKTRLTQENIKVVLRVGDVDNDSSCLCAFVPVPLRVTFLSSCPNTRPDGHGG